MNMCWHVSARHFSFRCSSSRLSLMTVNHYTKYIHCKAIHWLREQKLRLSFISPSVIHWFGTFASASQTQFHDTAGCKVTLYKKKKLILSSILCMCVFKLAPALASPNLWIFFILSYVMNWSSIMLFTQMDD